MIALGFAWIAGRDDSEQVYAKGIFFAVLLSLMVVLVGPTIADRWGHVAVYGTIGLATALYLPLLRYLPRSDAQDSFAPKSDMTAKARKQLGWQIFLLFYLAVLLVNASNAFVYMYVERMGRHLSIASEVLGPGLSFAQVFGLAGAWVAGQLGYRYGLHWPLLGTTIGVGAAPMGMAQANSATLLLGSAALLNGCLFMWVPYALGLAAILDPQGRVSAVLGALFPLGNALGAVLGGYAIQSSGFTILGWMSIIAAIVAALLFLPVLKWARPKELIV